MSTFHGVSGGAGCSNCGNAYGAHGPLDACPLRVPSQPLSRVIAGPAACACGGADCLGPEDNERHQCGGPREACGAPGCGECGKPADESPPSASFVATVAALRELAPEQRAALVQIGEDAVDLLAALDVIDSASICGSAADRLAATDRLLAVFARIERRQP